MNKDFWLAKWQNHQINFHESEGNLLLRKHFKSLELSPGARVFVPLCGKTLDMAWLLSQGYEVVGVELIESAITQLFVELNVLPHITKMPEELEEEGGIQGSFVRYSAEGIQIWVGDIFNLSSEHLGRIDAVFDRAALVALPQEMRTRYTQHVAEITKWAPLLLNVCSYDQHEMQGPPFSISETEIHQHYASRYQIQLLESVAIEGGLKGGVPAQENAWLLRSIQ
jgi:thiopurine S-methyltransferase